MHRREAPRLVARRLRPDDRRRRALRLQAGDREPTPVVRAGPAGAAGHRRGEDRRAGPRDGGHPRLARRDYYRKRPLAGNLGHGRRGRPGQPGPAPVGPAAVVHGSPRRSCSAIWGNLNHPYIEVENTAAAVLRFENGGLGNILVSNSQKPGIHGKVHVHGTSGASVGVQTDGGAMFVAGMSQVSGAPGERPVDRSGGRRSAWRRRKTGHSSPPSMPPPTITVSRSAIFSRRSPPAANPS